MLEKFITYLKVEKRYSSHTIVAYSKDVQQFFEFAQLISVNDVKEVHSKLVILSSGNKCLKLLKSPIKSNKLSVVDCAECVLLNILKCAKIK